MKIYVRRRHIKEGRRGVNHECPIALAFREATGKVASVGGMSLGTNEGRHILPLVAQRFIKRFDSGKPVKPFAFTIRA